MDGANPYAGPSSNYPDHAVRSTRSGQAFVGFCVGVGLTYAMLLPLSGAYLWLLVAQGVPVDKLYAQAYASTGFILLSHAVGFATTIAGGYWASRFGKDLTMVPAILAGLANILLVSVQYIMPYDFPQPGWSRAVSLAGPLPAFLIGAWLAHRARRASPAAQLPL